MKNRWLGMVRILTVAIGLAGACAAGAAEPVQKQLNTADTATRADYKKVAGQIAYRHLGEYSVERLNQILTTERAAFSNFAVDYPPAVNAVDLYQVIYETVIPEDHNRPVQVSGLIAVPKVEAAELPVVSYQHGTVFSRDEVPSNIEKSAETRLAVAIFAGRGYLVIAPDYVGKGISTEPDGWLVKEVTAQACVDMLAAARAVAADLKIKPGKLFLSGWSQGSFSTAAFMHRLEGSNVPVVAAAVASSPNDIYVAVNRWIHVPSPLDVHWLVGTAALLVHAYGHYYQIPGLAATAIKPQYQATALDFYENRIDWNTAAKTLPATVKELFRDEFIARNSPQAARLFAQMQLNSSYNWRFKTPVYYYYGMIDEVMTPYMVQLPVEYQKSIGGAEAQAINAGEKADHRGTFLFGLKDQLRRFEALRNGKQLSE